MGGVKPSQNLSASICRANGTFTDFLEEIRESLMNTLVPGDTDNSESPERATIWEEKIVRVGFFGL